MNVSLSNALNGLSLNTRRAEKAAVNILEKTSFDQAKLDQLNERQPLAEADTSPALESSVVELGVSEIGYKANAKVIDAQRQMDDALLDILA